MRSKILYIIILIILFILFSMFLCPNKKSYYIKEVVSPCEIILNNDESFKLSGYETFDSKFNKRNKELANLFGLSEEEAFVIGNFAKDWASNILSGRKINVYQNDLVYYKFGYKSKFENSPYCIKDGKFLNKDTSEKLINTVKRTDYVFLNLKDDKTYPIAKDIDFSNCIVVKKGYKKKSVSTKTEKIRSNNILNLKNVKIILSDMTTKLKPDRNCSTDMCKEILTQINHANKSIDIAIYGYSTVPALENALSKAIQRGVEIRLVYDSNAKGENIYENTFDLVKLIKNSKSDINSSEANAIMHNKFYIFDNKTVITGSANLSHTDMSGYNSNVITVINSPEIANIYKSEFEQMYNGKFHTAKIAAKSQSNAYFSPQDKPITREILPLIRKAQRYIYIPAFLITEKQLTSELINAKKRGVDVKIITDALNASSKYSKVKELRNNGIPVKIENYAGKMHSKTIIIDDKYLIVGSMNFSYSGENKNDENLLIIDNIEAAKFYKEFFLYLWTKIPDKWLKFYPRAEGKDSIGSCSDGIDNDYDGLIDNADEGCKN